MATTLTKPDATQQDEGARASEIFGPMLHTEQQATAIDALQAAFPMVPVTTIARTMTFLGLVQDGMAVQRRTGKPVTPTRYADIVDAATANAFDMSRCRQ